MATAAFYALARHRPVSRRSVHRRLNLIRRLGGAVRVWRGRSHDRALLARLTTRELQDIGMSSTDAYYESAQPFWRGLPPVQSRE